MKFDQSDSCIRGDVMMRYYGYTLWYAYVNHRNWILGVYFRIRESTIGASSPIVLLFFFCEIFA